MNQQPAASFVDGLPSRWQGRDRFVVLHSRFGDGADFLAAAAAWQADLQRCARLHVIGLAAATAADGALVAPSALDAETPLLQALLRQWPPATPDLHRLVFADGSIELLLAFGDADRWLPRLVASVDAFMLDAAAAAVWDVSTFKAIGRLAAPNAMVSMRGPTERAQAGLRSAGFEIGAPLADGGKQDVVLARYAPRFVPRRAPAAGTRWSASGSASAVAGAEPVLIVGAGLAGTALAAALAERGRRSVLLERCEGVAEQGSGNAAGIFHGVVHASDGCHARFFRAAALAAGRAVEEASARGVRGAVSGLLRIVPAAAGKHALQATIDRLGLPTGYVRAVDAAEASAIAGVPIAAPAWHVAAGGWVDPRGLARYFLERAGTHATLRTGVQVGALHRERSGWVLLDERGETVAHSPVVVLANAGGAPALLGDSSWPVTRVRGQLSGSPAAHWPARTAPNVPIAGAGYVLPPIDGTVWFGATSQADDDDASVRVDDHTRNVERLQDLLASPPTLQPSALCGRTAFRFVAADRLPIIGAVPAARMETDGGPSGQRLDQVRFVARAPGLYVCTALGSRGIAVSILGAQVLAASITGSPAPLSADLLAAIDPARFRVRAFRRGSPGAAKAAAVDQPPVGPIADGSTGGN